MKILNKKTYISILIILTTILLFTTLIITDDDLTIKVSIACNDSKITYYNDNTTAYYSAEYFNFGSYRCLKDTLNTVEEFVIQDNKGGSVLDSILISKLIQKNDIKVVSNGVCFSACSTILFSSNKATATHHAVIGTHQSNLQKFTLLSPLNNFALKTKMDLFKKSKRDFNTDFYNQTVSETTFDRMRIIKQQELLKYNLIDHFVINQGQYKI